MAESEELKSLLMKVKEEREKVGLKFHTALLYASYCSIILNDSQTKFRKQRSWHLVPSLHGKWMGKQYQTLFLGGSKITADGDYSHEIKRRLLLGRKVMTNLDSIFKSRDITLPTNVRLVKAMVFSVVMYGCELDCEER